MTSLEKKKSWLEKILEFKSSGKTKEAWCEKNNISLRQFSYWFRHLGNYQPTQWLPLEIKESETGIPENITEEKLSKLPINIKIGAASIEVYPDIDKEFLLEILRFLQSI